MEAQDLEPRVPDRGDAADTVSLLDLVGVLVKRRRLIIIVTVVVTALALGFLLVTKALPVDSPYNMYPDYFKPSAKILLQESSGGSLLADASSSALGALAGLVNISGIRSSSAQLAIELLKTNSIRDKLAAEFDFAGRFHLTKAAKTAAREMISKALTATYTGASGILEVSYQGIDPAFATDILNRAVVLLQESFNTLTQERVTIKIGVLNDDIAAKQTEADAATKALIDFQKRWGIVDLASQTPASVEGISTLYGKRLDKMLDLNVRKQYYPANDPQIAILQAEIGELDKAIAGMMTGYTGNIPQNLVPEVAAQYAVLRSNAELQLGILLSIRQQYEAAKLEKLNTSSSLQIIQPAEVPELKAGPGRSKVAMIAAVSGFLVAVLLAFLREYFSRAQLDPQERRKLALIRESLGRRRRR